MYKDGTWHIKGGDRRTTTTSIVAKRSPISATAEHLLIWLAANSSRKGKLQYKIHCINTQNTQK